MLDDARGAVPVSFSAAGKTSVMLHPSCELPATATGGKYCYFEKWRIRNRAILTVGLKSSTAVSVGRQRFQRAFSKFGTRALLAGANRTAALQWEKVRPTCTAEQLAN
jgi:hypothetical protein